MTRSAIRGVRVVNRRILVVAAIVLAVVPLVDRGPADAASSKPSATLEQCENGAPTPQNCDWVTGNLGPHNSHWAEDDFVAYRLKLGNLSTSGTHTVTIEWDPTKAGKHAFDYLGTFNATEASADPCTGVSGCTLATSSTTSIPGDGNVPFSYTAGNFTIWNGAFVSLSAYSTSGSYAGDSSTRITLTFTASASNPVIAWSGHIGTSADWAPAQTASTISGSPYHMRLIEVDGFGGNQDRSLKVAPGPIPSSITIVKQATTENDRQFSFSASDGLGNFTLVDDGDDAAVPLNSMTFDGLTDFYSVTSPNTYDFTETVPTGWALSSITCSTGADVTVAGSTLTVRLTENTHVTCTYHNTDLLPTITVTKTPDRTTVPEPGGRVTFVVEIDNTSTETVTVDSLLDSVYGDLADGANTKLVASTCAVGSAVTIAAGGSRSCSFTVDMVGDAGFVENNVVEATVHDADDNSTDATGSATVTVTDVLPVIAVDKSASKAAVRTGETVTYTYVVTTPGAEPLLDVDVADDKCSPVTFTGGDANGDGKLDPAESWTYTCATALTGTTVNTVTVDAEDNEGNTTSATDTATVKVVNPRIAIDKSADPKSATPGDRVVYTYLVTNPGDAELTDVVVTDDKCSPVTRVSGDAALDPGETWTYTCEVTVGSDARSLTNIGTVTAKDPTGGTVSADDTETITIVLGVTFERSRTAPAATATAQAPLPRTGQDIGSMAMAGGALVALGSILLAWSPRRRRTT